MKTIQQRFLSVARALARVSEAADLRVGCVVVSEDGRVIGSGFNDEKRNPVQHAEIMALDQTNEILHNIDIYVTTSPCIACARRIALHHPRTVYYQYPWWDKAALQILHDHGVKTQQLKRETR